MTGNTNDSFLGDTEPQEIWSSALSEMSATVLFFQEAIEFNKNSILVCGQFYAP